MLARRPFLGFELRARRPADEVRDGFEIVRVVPESTAALAGVCPGDFLVSVNEHAVHEPKELARYVRTLRPGAPLQFVVDRAGKRLTLEGQTIPLPIEKVANAEVHLGEVTVSGCAQRTILTTPMMGTPPFTTILYLPGLGTQSLELSVDPDEPVRRFIEGVSAAGLATLRVERSGLGDSEGAPFQTTNLFDDLEASRAALVFLANHPLVGRVFLFGHSAGGMIAPLLAGEDTNLAGIAVFGTSSERWVDCIVEATGRQKKLAGLSGDELETYVTDWARMHHAVCREGLLPWQVFDRHPELGWLEGSACHGETMFGRHARYFQQIERLDLKGLWKTVRTKVLVMHGEFDWAAGPEAGRVLASVIEDAQPANVRLVEFSAVGHDMRRHASIEESYANPRSGVWDERVVESVVEWIRLMG